VPRSPGHGRMGRMDDTFATSFSAALPDWLVAELDGIAGRPLGTAEERMTLVNELADRNWRAGNGGPFAAIVVDAASGALVSVGVNVVLATGLSSVHAEVMALSLAQRALGRWDLGAEGAELELVVNWRPCVMCYGATMWSGVRALTIAGEGAEVEELTGFDEGPMPEDWAGEFERRGIRVSVGTGHDEAIAVFRAFGASDAVVYNARGGAED
jgi:tRNA(Arg) A34 adenosine deaminase TadA